MADEAKLSKLEHIKGDSQQLRGTIQEELLSEDPSFSADSIQLLKHHGTYQQDNRDARKEKNEDGTKKGKQYSCMVRTRIPGGKVTAEQFLAELDLCDRLGSGNIRITTRQGLQLHGILKGDLKETIRKINDTMLTTFCACGDVERNVMCCPAPYKNNSVHQEMQDTAFRIAEHLKPKTTSYYDIWLKDVDDDEAEKINMTDFKPVDEPIYGATYLPRKFKTAITLPEDNCIDVYTHDLGFIAIVEDDKIVGYNVLVGGGMGRTPSNKKTFPALSKKMAYIKPEQVLEVAEAIVKVQRDFGNREDRKVARLKYLIANWGIPKFKAKVEEYYGQSLDEPLPVDVHGVDDHMGWHEQGDGKLFLGVNIENGRIKDDGDLRIKTCLRILLEKYGMECRFTALQAVILCDIDPKDKDDIEATLKEHGMKLAEDLSLVRRYSIACPALPTCALSITESERVLPSVIDTLEKEIAKAGLEAEQIAVHMTGCPNGCARPYNCDIGLNGRAVGKYTLFLGGNVQGTRLSFIYEDMVPLEEITPKLVPLLKYFKEEREEGELFGDFCSRKGQEDLASYAEKQAG